MWLMALLKFTKKTGSVTSTMNDRDEENEIKKAHGEVYQEHFIARCRKLRSCGIRVDIYIYIYIHSYVCSCSCSNFEALTVPAEHAISGLARASSFEIRASTYITRPFYNLLEHREKRDGMQSCSVPPRLRRETSNYSRRDGF